MSQMYVVDAGFQIRQQRLKKLALIFKNEQSHAQPSRMRTVQLVTWRNIPNILFIVIQEHQMFNKFGFASKQRDKATKVLYIQCDVICAEDLMVFVHFRGIPFH